MAFSDPNKNFKTDIQEIQDSFRNFEKLLQEHKSFFDDINKRIKKLEKISSLEKCMSCENEFTNERKCACGCGELVCKCLS